MTKQDRVRCSPSGLRLCNLILSSTTATWLEGRQRPFGETVEEAVATLETVLGVGDDDPAIGAFSRR